MGRKREKVEYRQRNRPKGDSVKRDKIRVLSGKIED